MSIETVVKENEVSEEQNQTVEEVNSEEVKAGDVVQAGGTAAPEMISEDTGLKKKEEGISVDDIMSGDVPKPKDDGSTLKLDGISEHAQERINSKIGAAVKDKKIAQGETKRLREENTHLKSMQDAPKEKPMVPVESSYETTEAYQKAYDAYQTSLNSYNKAQNSLMTKAENDRVRLLDNDARLARQKEELKEKFPDVESAIDSADYGYARQDISDSDHSARIGLYLAKNESERIRIGSIANPVTRVKEIGKLEARFDAVKGKKTTNAPAALDTIKADTDTVVKDINKIENDDDWFKARQAEKMKKFKEK